MYEKDYIMRIIKNLIKSLARVFFGKNVAVYELSGNKEYIQSDNLHQKLLVLLSDGQINEAENLLFAELDPKKNRQMMVAIDFYQRLNDLDDEFLKTNSFSREEIEEGLQDIAKKAGVITYKIQ